MKKYWVGGALIAACLAALLEWQKRKIDLQAAAWRDAGADEI